ncbi:hypothetical protein EJD97_024740 [Solanum chilense]|uniref:Uncharacterized protein n=1 Tax=Solanum chilense TaxID=4083 RepID=A0A6N2C132_SOLCI|nr:hypothetical protein EJD97_024740 [Solanum chilense]
MSLCLTRSGKYFFDAANTVLFNSSKSMSEISTLSNVGYLSYYRFFSLMTNKPLLRLVTHHDGLRFSFQPVSERCFQPHEESGNAR